MVSWTLRALGFRDRKGRQRRRKENVDGRRWFRREEKIAAVAAAVKMTTTMNVLVIIVPSLLPMDFLVFGAQQDMDTLTAPVLSVLVYMLCLIGVRSSVNHTRRKEGKRRVSNC
ncbi:fructose-bisphosphate aldolase, chloroplastic-like [Iris pallida]|uniref:Fructose-bisphosphate aldolase, chloroplastic-like n=1 Tax=Iris pallida TaxID=29817 RepID=A0AAX6IJV8_IRIPA|nr:fructose-bisphosphate aldolase, chloroplastic-like [Iris pallida]KAJ6853430.1 fructose-bisphosphate aldolase, chloroplastic-like [Iris pallida]KAJ6853502.1 fructose-bisphosphate aldolase, chloroplastic-like [Iris pallida]